jgi:hypothetical protein
MILMGGIVGYGIFINPYVVAQQVHTPPLILGVCSACSLPLIGVKVEIPHIASC